ncbi:MAG TPA: ABC transporter permease [Stellaceae bacterium]|nr:ABC transporter permease [Stellaceae bacterium]
MPGRSLQSWGWALALPPVLFLLAFFVGPLLYLLYVSFHGSSTSDLYSAELTLANYAAIASDPFYLRVLLRTLETAAAIMGLCLAVGYPVAMVVAKLPRHRREIASILLLLPLMVSNVVRAYGWVAILGRRGLVNIALGKVGLIDAPLALLYTPAAVVLGLATILLPYMVISIANTLASLDRRYEEAAQALGAGPIRTFLHVTLPLSSPGVASGLLLVFLLTLSAYVTVTLLGGPPSKLLVSLVYDNVVSFQWPRAAALAFVLLAVALIVSALILAVLRPGRVRGRSR